MDSAARMAMGSRFRLSAAHNTSSIPFSGGGSASRRERRTAGGRKTGEADPEWLGSALLGKAVGVAEKGSQQAGSGTKDAAFRGPGGTNPQFAQPPKNREMEGLLASAPLQISAVGKKKINWYD